jgi:hypothetical protein
MKDWKDIMNEWRRREKPKKMEVPKNWADREWYWRILIWLTKCIVLMEHLMGGGVSSGGKSSLISFRQCQFEMRVG